MKMALACIIGIWAMLQIGCATIRDIDYNLTMTQRDGIIFIGFACDTPSGWTGDRSAQDAIVGVARRIIDAELMAAGFADMTIEVQDPMSYESATARLEFFASAGDMPRDQLISKTKAIVAADSLAKHSPKPFYRSRGSIAASILPDALKDR